MVILDFNIFIYLANGTLNRRSVADKDIAHASIAKIESLGFSRIHANELLLLEALFGESYNLVLTDSIVDRAIKLRQAKSMSLGDSIVAATALEHNYELWTANDEDFVAVAQSIKSLALQAGCSDAPSYPKNVSNCGSAGSP